MRSYLYYVYSILFWLSLVMFTDPGNDALCIQQWSLLSEIDRQAVVRQKCEQDCVNINAAHGLITLFCQKINKTVINGTEINIVSIPPVGL